MRKTIRRIVCMTAALLVLFSLAPAPARAVDPVSAATMANALAQAITAYGASNGVSMMYDVTDTEGIGEGVHDLWDQFKADINDNDVPTYDSLAVTTWSTIYKKIGNSVAINLSDTVVSYLDRFWNWLLSGPAEMTKIDNQYYEWTLSQSGNVVPIDVYSISSTTINGYQMQNFPYRNNNLPGVFTCSDPNGIWCASGSSNWDTRFWFLSSLQNQAVTISYNAAGTTPTVLNLTRVYSGSGISYYYVYFDIRSPSPAPPYVSTNSSTYDVENILGSLTPASVEVESDNLSIRPYIGDTVPQDVYIPDNDDVNYQPLPYVGPLNIPWQNAWGDGETIDDAGAQDIADALDQQIVDDGTLQLEGDNTVNPPIDDVIGGPDDYQVPGLADVFPFCIPFDIYNFLSALAADPVAPHFTAQLDFPEAIGGTQTIDIDFDSPTWNQLAQLLRLLELLAFIVGLALLTRSMFIRG